MFCECVACRGLILTVIRGYGSFPNRLKEMSRQVVHTSQSRRVTPESDPTRIESRKHEIDADLELVKAISGGSIAAWHEFLDRYSGLIHGVVRRHLFSEDEDEVRSVYVDILQSLYNGEIAKFQPRAHLATWLIVYTRSRSLDFFRKRYGRCRTPKGYNRLSEFDKRVLRLYFMQRLPLEIVVNALEWKGPSVAVEDIIESIQHIEDVVDRRYLNRLDSEYQAEKCGAHSVRALRCLIQLRLEYEEKIGLNRADSHILEKEMRERVSRLRKLVSALSSEEQEVILLRFDRGWSAKKIAERLELGGQRRAYTLIDRVLRKLRRSMLAEGDI